MLVLSRKRHETICIGGQIEVKVLEIRGSTVRLGISAPPEVRVHREEIARKLCPEIDQPASPLLAECTDWSSPVLTQCG